MFVTLKPSDAVELGGRVSPMNHDAVSPIIVARLLGTSAKTVSKWIDEGLLGGYRLPPTGTKTKDQHRRTTKADLITFVKQHITGDMESVLARVESYFGPSLQPASDSAEATAFIDNFK